LVIVYVGAAAAIIAVEGFHNALAVGN